ncbi:hypothetical protein E2C01_021730 [Portunus trituberculatus]|uniref:Uncharacterized protein n=1 Tax=Portunus trituberculatus TaxID=210409 RepID=A0A5B7E5C8_PORTR|nr:hypothetical protein [Portunus trituberculatus]
MAPSTEKMATEAIKEVMKSSDDTMNASITSIMHCLTSPILICKVWKSPDISNANRQANAGEHKLSFGSPVSPSNFF